MAYVCTSEEIRAAHTRIENFVHRTPVLTSTTMNGWAGAQHEGGLWFKCENLQRTGSFKIRGALHAVLQRSPWCRHVVTHSSGNHAQGLALAAKLCDIEASIVMPSNTAAIKCEAVRGYGANVIFCEPTLAAREATASAIVQASNDQVMGSALFVHPYNDGHVIAGQGTVALELLEQAPNLDAIVIPVGGGGLISGMTIFTKETCPRVRIVGAEPSMAADAFESKLHRSVVGPKATHTIADGLRTALGSHTRPVVQDLVDEIILVDEDEIRQALRWVLERMKLVIEPSAGVTVAAAKKLLQRQANLRVGAVLCGGNLDLDARPWLRA